MDEEVRELFGVERAGEEVTIKTVVASMVHKGNLEEAQHGTPRVDKTEE